MDAGAQMSCVFKVNVHCKGCREKIMEVLQNLRGVYSVVIDSEQGTVKVNGKVNPVEIMGVFERYGKHGDVSSIRFDGEVMEPHNYFYGDYPYMPYEMPYPPPPPPYMHPLYIGPEQQYYGTYQYPMPPMMPPSLPQLLPPATAPPPPRPPATAAPTTAPPPTAGAPATQAPAPPPPANKPPLELQARRPKCSACTVM